MLTKEVLIKRINEKNTVNVGVHGVFNEFLISFNSILQVSRHLMTLVFVHSLVHQVDNVFIA